MSKTKKENSFIPKNTQDIEALQRYLSEYGYYVSSEQADDDFDFPPDINGDDDVLNISGKLGTMDNATKKALLSFQKFNGLKHSGKLDKETLNQMNQKRCACPDHEAFTISGKKWNKTALTYGFKNYSPDLSRRDTEQAIAQAFAMWAAETPLSFRKTSYASNPDIRIEFKNIDNPGNTLAYAYFPPPNGGALAGDAVFDEYEKWTITIPLGAGKTDLVTVAAHEFGHSLGLRHSTVNGALMLPYYSGAHRFLHSDDINGIRKIYGSYKIAQAPWIHGTSIQIEYPERLTSIRRAGFYTSIVGKANTTNWFHFAIPSPVIVDSKRLKIIAAILRFRTLSKKAIVKHVHIYDGYSRIASHNDLNLTGAQWFKKLGVAHKPSIYWGLGISIGVAFKAGSTTERRMDFVSAGCDLME